MAQKIKRGWVLLRDWVLAQPAQGPSSAADIQLSALRVVLLSSLVLAAVVGLHVAWEGWQRDKPWAVAIVAAIVLLLAGASSQARHAGRAGALWLLAAVYVAGLAITASTGSQPALSRLGYVLCYAAPMLAGLLVAWPLALGLMVFNTLLFGLALSAWEAPQLPDQQVRLPHSQAYVHGALYIFFNLCLPLAMFRVVAGMRRVERQLRGWRHLSEQVFQVASGPTLVCDEQGRVLRCNKPFLALCGRHDEQELRGRSLSELFEDAEGGDGVWRSQPGLRWHLAECRSAEGRSRELTLRSVRSLGDRLSAYAFDDVSELRRVQADLAASVQREVWATWHDPLTGLPNRARSIQQLDAQLAQGTPGLALLSLRLCNLRQLNARYGVPAGDALLRDFVAALRRLLPPGAQAARVRGSVIAVLLPGQHRESEALAEVRRLQQTLPLQAETSRQAVLLDLVCGLVMVDERRLQHPGVDGAELLRCSELALDMAQDPRWREGSEGVLLFNAQTAAGVARSMAIEAELPQALVGDQLHLLYQPQRDVRGGLLGFEVLVRWNSPALGEVPPAEFIPVAEACGLVGGITDWVLDAACAQLALWRRELGAGQALPRLAVNLSAHDLEREGFEQQLMQSLVRHRVRPAELELEVTESALARHPALALAQLRRLHGAGLRIAIDDFGTGYSSLAKLVDLPIDVLKIDRSFLRDLPGDARRGRVVDSMISLARSLRLEVLAEGVETEDQHLYLRERGVDGLQGWLFGRPQPAAYWLPLLRRECAAQPEPA